MRAKPKANEGILINDEGISVVIYLNTRQVWEVTENPYDSNRVKVVRQNVKLNITKEEFARHFEEVK